jgi:hypothetical protein
MKNSKTFWILSLILIGLLLFFFFYKHINEAFISDEDRERLEEERDTRGRGRGRRGRDWRRNFRERELADKQAQARRDDELWRNSTSYGMRWDG